MKLFKHSPKLLIALLFSLSLNACNVASFVGVGVGIGTFTSLADLADVTEQDAIDYQLTAIENDLLAFINDERVDNGLPELVRDPGLDAVMTWYGVDMVLDEHIGHVDINGRRSADRVNYYSQRNDVRCSEITAWWTNGDAEDHYNAYFNSPGHHAAYMEEGIFNLGPTTHVGVVVMDGTGPMGSQYEGVAGTYSGLVFCDQPVSLVIDPFSE